MIRRQAQPNGCALSANRLPQPTDGKNTFNFQLLTLAIALILCVASTGCIGVTGANNQQPPGGGPAISVPTSLAFGSVLQGGAGTQTLTIGNTGSSTLTISGMAITGAAYTFNSALTYPISIATNQSVMVSIRFAPTATGATNGTLTIASNASTTATTVALTGTGAASQAQLTVNPDPIAFGTVTVGGASQTQVLLNNPGSTTLTISAVNMSGPGFEISGAFSVPMNVAPGGVGQFTARFVPPSSGAMTGNMTITSNASSTPMTVPLSGTGTGTQALPQISVGPNPVLFGNVTTGTTSPVTVTISNPGSATLNVTAISAAGTGFSATGYTLPIALGAGKNVSFTAHFAPATAGLSNGSISLSSNASPATLVVPMSGTGVAAAVPQISVTPSPVPFSNVAVNGSATQIMTINNRGNATLTVTALSASGTGYSVNGFTLPISVGAGSSANFNAVFAPTVAGLSNGTISLTSNATPAVTTVSMTGTGVQSGITATPASATFTSVIVGTTNSQTIKLQNAGTTSVTINTAAVSGTGVTITGLTTPATITGGASTTFNIVYSPLAAATLNGSVVLTGTMSNSPLTIPVTGSSVAATEVLNSTSNTITFGNVNIGSNSPMSVTLTNNGNTSLTISTITTTGTGMVASGVTAGQVFTAGQQVPLTVTFTPTNTTPVSGSVVITSTASNSPLTITLTGTGVSTIVHSVVLNWTASTSNNVVGYNVYRGSTTGGPYTLITSAPVSGVTYTDTTVVAGQTYFYVVTAIDNNGNESVNSNEVSATVPTP